MLLPFLSQKPVFDVLPSHRLTRFYDEPEPPLAFLQGCFTKEGLHLQLRAYEQPNFHSYFCFSLLSGRKLQFSKNIFPGRPDPSLQSTPIEGENLIGRFWGTELLIPYSLCSPPLSGIIGLFHDEIPLCFLSEEEATEHHYPLVTFIPEPHPAPSSEENPKSIH